MSLKEYNVDESNIVEWLAWGGIIRPSVMRQKDGSFFSVIEYRPYKNAVKMPFIDFSAGWIVQNEEQHSHDGKRGNFIVITWNPSHTARGSFSENTLNREKVYEKDYADYFVSEIKKISEELAKFTEVKILEYEKMLNYLQFALNNEYKEIDLPEVPLYIDALLTQDNEYLFYDNDIQINGKHVVILSFKGLQSSDIIAEAIQHLDYRYVRRLVMLDRSEAEKALKRYSSAWCSGRQTVKDLMMENIIKNYNGYFNECFIFSVAEEKTNKLKDYLAAYMNEAGVPYIIEDFNMKDIWWGCVPGNIYASIYPPVLGFDNLEDMLSEV